MKILCLIYDTTKMKCETRRFSNARQAWDELKKICPLLICNMEAQDNGLAICRCIKGDSSMASLHHVIHTLGQDMEAQARYWQAGAELLLSDPYAGSQAGSHAAQLPASDGLPQGAPDNSSWICEGKIMHDEDWVLINQLMGTILENISDASLTPAFIAEKMNIGLRTLYRKLKEICNMPLTGIIQEQRIEYARQLLIQTRMSVKEICYKSGFSNHSTFYKQFAEKHGCTPRKYREQMTEQKKESDEEK